jgi:hypothetical protein
MASGYWAPLAIATAAGPSATAASNTSVLPLTALFTFPPNSFGVGTALRVHASGQISCVVTTPGTARFDLRLGTTVIFDTGPMNLNIIAKVTLPFWFDAMVTCRAVGASGNFMGMGRFTSEAVIASPLATAGGVGTIISAVSGGPETIPAVGGAVNTTISQAFDFQFTQTAATGLVIVQQFILESGSIMLT